MKKLYLTGALALVAAGTVFAGACLATGNCQNKINLPSVVVTPLNASPATEKEAAKVQKIAWYTSLPDALEESKKTGKPVFIDFFATWCPPCKMMDEQTYPDPTVIKEAQKWIMVRIDTDKQTDVAMKYGIRSLPTLGVVKSDGKPVTAMMGFVDAKGFVQFLQDAEKKFAAQK